MKMIIMKIIIMNNKMIIMIMKYNEMKNDNNEIMNK